MSILLDRINSAPLWGEEFGYEFQQWISNTIDTLNENYSDIDNLLVSQEVIANNVVGVNAVVNSLYIPTNALQTVFQLPATTNEDIGSIIEIAGQGAGGWSILTAPGQTIEIANVGATANTSVTSSSRYDSIKIILVAASTWITLSTQTTGFVIV